MKSERAALRYAKALLDFSIEGQEEKNVFDEMQNILRVIRSSKDLNDVLNNPVLPTKQKRLIIKEVFDKRSNSTEMLFDLLSKNNREGILDIVAQKYLELYDKYQGKVIATVTTAVPLNEALKKKVLQKAAELSSLKIELKNIIDSKIKGGFILKVGDLQFNASIAERMETLKRELITSKKNS